MKAYLIVCYDNHQDDIFYLRRDIKDAIEIARNFCKDKKGFREEQFFVHDDEHYHAYYGIEEEHGAYVAQLEIE